MEIKENKRLKEIKLSIHINHIDKAEDKLIYSKLIKMLSCLVAALGKEQHVTFLRVVQLSVGECFLRASNKEIVATTKTFFSNKKAAEKMGVTNATFYNRYKDLLNRNFVNDTFLESLNPIFETPEEQFVINFLNNFIDNFTYTVGNNNTELRSNERTLEIEFWLIYDKLMSILHNSTFCDKFIFNICNLFEIDYSSVAHLKNNIHIINRSYPTFRYSNRYFMQEIVYLYTQKGLNKSTIGAKLLGKDYSFLYRGTNKKYSDLIGSEDVEWQYTPTIDWNHIKKGDVMKFIDLFHTWLNYDV